MQTLLHQKQLHTECRKEAVARNVRICRGKARLTESLSLVQNPKNPLWPTKGMKAY